MAITTMMSASADSLNRLGKLRRRADGDGDTLTLSSGDIRRLVAKSARLSLDNLAVDRRNSGEPDTGPLTTSEEQQAARAVLFGDDDEVELRIREHVDRCNEEERMLAHKQQRWSRPPLYNFDDVPRFLRDHCFIRGGYRAHYTMAENWRSVFRVHNETGNIWSHLIPGLGCAAFLVYGVEYYFDRMAFATLTLSACICFLSSALFHTHNNASQAMYARCGCLDYAGISAMIGGSGLLLTYLSHYCDPWSRTAWMGLIVLLGMTGVVGPHFHVWHTRTFRPYRAFIYIACCLASLLPTALYVARNGLPPIDIEGWGNGLWFMVAANCFGGVFIYAKEWPERWAPGRFDTLLNSHQIWHIAIVAAMSFFYVASVKVLDWRLGDGACPV